MSDAADDEISAGPDFARFPAGEREWSEFVHRVAASGDLAERHFLELKSDIDPTKDGAAKIAKFILGAANRDPERAAKYLEGHAVMILGVSEGDVRGLERFEAKDLVGPFAEELVLVPEHAVERWLSQRLSHILGRGSSGDGVCAGVVFTPATSCGGRCPTRRTIPAPPGCQPPPCAPPPAVHPRPGPARARTQSAFRDDC